MGWSWSTFDIDAKTQCPHQESFSLHLVGLERCIVLRVVTVKWNNHGRSLSTTIDQFERCIRRKEAIYWSWKSSSNPTSWQCPTTCCESDSRLYLCIGNCFRTRRIAQTWRLPITIYFGRYSITWLIHITWDIKRYENALMTYRFEAGELLSSRNSQATRKMAKGHWCKRGIFRWLIFCCLFFNKDWILQKKAQNFFAHLIII